MTIARLKHGIGLVGGQDSWPGVNIVVDTLRCLGLAQIMRRRVIKKISKLIDHVHSGLVLRGS